MIQPQSAADRIRAILADPAAQRDPNMQNIWLDEMALIVSILDRLAEMAKSATAAQRGANNGQAMLAKILDELKAELFAKLDKVLTADIPSMPQATSLDGQLFIAELKAVIKPTAPEAIKATSAALTAAINTFLASTPFLVTKSDPRLLALVEAIKKLQEAL